VPSLKVTLLVPKFYNDGKQVEVTKHRKTAQELTKRFKGCTQDNTPLLGQWTDPDTGATDNDVNFAFWVICQDTPRNLLFLKKYKDKLKIRYKQKEILMYAVTVRPI
jgi:hypothetical protein